MPFTGARMAESFVLTAVDVSVNDAPDTFENRTELPVVPPSVVCAVYEPNRAKRSLRKPRQRRTGKAS